MACQYENGVVWLRPRLTLDDSLSFNYKQRNDNNMDASISGGNDLCLRWTPRIRPIWNNRCFYQVRKCRVAASMIFIVVPCPPHLFTGSTRSNLATTEQASNSSSWPQLFQWPFLASIDVSFPRPTGASADDKEIADYMLVNTVESSFPTSVDGSCPHLYT